MPAIRLARFRVLHSAITWASRNKLILTDPLDGMRASPGPLRRLHLRPEQVHRLVETADDAVARLKLGRPNVRTPGSVYLFRAEPNALLVQLAATAAPAVANSPHYNVRLQDQVFHICPASQDGIIGPVRNHLTGRLTLATRTVNYWDPPRSSLGRAPKRRG